MRDESKDNQIVPSSKGNLITKSQGMARRGLELSAKIGIGDDILKESIPVEEPWKEVYETADDLYWGREWKDVEQDYKEALKLFKQAANLGCNKAFQSIGFMYECGKGCEKNIRIASRYYEKGAQVGDSKCWADLAAIHFDWKNYENSEICWNKYFTSDYFLENTLEENHIFKLGEKDLFDKLSSSEIMIEMVSDELFGISMNCMVFLRHAILRHKPIDEIKNHFKKFSIIKGGIIFFCNKEVNAIYEDETMQEMEKEDEALIWILIRETLEDDPYLFEIYHKLPSIS